MDENKNDYEKLANKFINYIKDEISANTAQAYAQVAQAYATLHLAQVIQKNKQALDGEWTPPQPKKCTCGSTFSNPPMHSQNCLRRDLGLPEYEALDGEQ